MISNVIQRDNVILAKKLHPSLEEVAKENDKNVRNILIKIFNFFSKIISGEG